MQSDQLTTNIPTHWSKRIDTGQQDDFDYQDNRDEELYQVDGTLDVQTPTNNSDDNEDDEPKTMHIKDKERHVAQLIQKEKKCDKQTY